MAILDIVFYFILLIILIAAIALDILASQSLMNQTTVNTNSNTFFSPNTLLIVSYVLLILSAILLIVNLIAGAFFSVPLATSASFRFPFYLMILVLIFVFISLILNAFVYFQMFGTDPTMSLFILPGNFSTYVLISTILIFIAFLMILIYTIYGSYFTSPCPPGMMPAAAEGMTMGEGEQEMIEMQELPPVSAVFPPPMKIASPVRPVSTATTTVVAPTSTTTTTTKKYVPTAAKQPCVPVANPC